MKYEVSFYIGVPDDTTEDQIMDWLRFELYLHRSYNGKGSPINDYSWDDLNPSLLTIRKLSHK